MNMQGITSTLKLLTYAVVLVAALAFWPITLAILGILVLFPSIGQTLFGGGNELNK
jgi:hypothetical protein